MIGRQPDAVDIQPVVAADLPALEARFRTGPADVHRMRLQAQRRGRATYLIAHIDSEPAGHALISWIGPVQRDVAAAYRGCPEVHDVLVLPDYRRQGVGAALMRAAEAAGQERGHLRMGLAVAVDNAPALSLYKREGYRDSGLTPFVLSGSWIDADGQEHAPLETCVWLVKDLTETG